MIQYVTVYIIYAIKYLLRSAYAPEAAGYSCANRGRHLHSTVSVLPTVSMICDYLLSADLRPRNLGASTPPAAVRRSRREQDAVRGGPLPAEDGDPPPPHQDGEGMG